jgi:hypothetical protein
MDSQGQWERIHKEKGLMRNLETSLELIKKFGAGTNFRRSKN